MNLLIRRCFEPDSIAFMKPPTVLDVVIVVVVVVVVVTAPGFDFVSVDVFDPRDVDETEEDEGEDDEAEEFGEESDVDDVNGMLTGLLAPVYLRKPTQVLQTCSQKPKLSVYTSRCAVIYLF